jgi:hypothetical protein
MALTLELVQECLNHVDDTAGLWQIEGERVLQSGGGEQVGNNSSVIKRVSCGAGPQNTGRATSSRLAQPEPWEGREYIEPSRLRKASEGLTRRHWLV